MSMRSWVAGVLRGAASSIDPIHPRDPALAKMFGMGMNTTAGVSVTHDKVLALPAVLRAVSIISNGMAKLPYYVFRENDDGRDWDRTHPSWTCVSRKAHPEITDGAFRQCMTAWAMMWGNAYAYIDAPAWPRGPVHLLPLLPDRTRPFRRTDSGDRSIEDDDAGRLMYATKIGNETRLLDASQVLHIRGLGPNPYVGYNVFELLSEAFGGSIALQEFGYRFFGQGANPSGWVTMDGRLDEESEERFIGSLSNAVSGLGKVHKIAVLEEGAKFTKWTVDPEAAQAVESKQLDARTLAMAVGIKVHKLIDGANSSYNSLEQANQEHKDDDLMPWICRWREELEDKLLTEDQKESGSHSIDVDDEALEWVPFSDRASGVVELYNNGLVDKDEGRRKVNFGPSKSPRAKDFKTPANISFENDSAVTSMPEPVEPSAPDEPEATYQVEYLAVAGAYLDNLASRLAKMAVTKSTTAEDFDQWIAGLKADRQSKSGPLPLQPAIDDLYAYIHTESKNCLLSTVTDAELKGAVEASSITFAAQAATIVEGLTA